MKNRSDSLRRCRWVGEYPPMVRYHDEEWGVPIHDDRLLFEFLILAGAQAGLTWRTILDRREHYRKAFRGFDARKIARSGLKPQAERLLIILRADPHQSPPPFEKLVGDLSGACSRRISIQHRLVYQVLDDVRTAKVIRMWTHYE